jgi:branched-chain amino acid transport system permease protein
MIINYVMIHWSSLTQGTSGLIVDSPELFGFVFDDDRPYFFVIVTVVIVATTCARNLQRTRVGRAFMAVRDNDLAAELIGIDLFRYKLLAFFVSAFYAGVAGSLWAHYVTIITPEHFTIAESINYLAMIIIGGIGSVLGSVLGAIFMVLLPEVLRWVTDSLSGVFPSIGNFLAAMKEVVFGLVIVLFLIFEPDGLNHRWQMIKAYWKLWPFSY